MEHLTVGTAILFFIGVIIGGLIGTSLLIAIEHTWKIGARKVSMGLVIVYIAIVVTVLYQLPWS